MQMCAEVHVLYAMVYIDHCHTLILYILLCLVLCMVLTLGIA